MHGIGAQAMDAADGGGEGGKEAPKAEFLSCAARGSLRCECLIS